MALHGLFTYGLLEFSGEVAIKILSTQGKPPVMNVLNEKYKCNARLGMDWLSGDCDMTLLLRAVLVILRV
jgi:hypothetical protein